jgi:hypothetical protein
MAAGRLLESEASNKSILRRPLLAGRGEMGEVAVRLSG